MSDWTATKERSEFVTFGWPYFDTGLVIMKPVASGGDDLGNVFSPFDDTLWACTGLFVLTNAFFFWWFESGKNTDVPIEERRIKRMGTRRRRLSNAAATTKTALKRVGSFSALRATAETHALGAMNSMYWPVELLPNTPEH